jgi:hypothetical protein
MTPNPNAAYLADIHRRKAAAEAAGHYTAVVYQREHILFLSGCSCGWVGPRRSLAQLSYTDEILHWATANEAERATS